VSDPKNPEASRALYWPAEWAVERLFWREVASRTLAGVFTLVVIGVPALIYAGAGGVLTPDQVWPILIGVALSALVVVIYVLVLRAFRRRERRKIEDARRAEETRTLVASLTEEEKARIVLEAMQEVTKAQRSYDVQAILSTIVALAAAAAAALYPALIR